MGCIFVFKIDLSVLYILYRRDTCKNFHVFVFTLAEDTRFMTRVEREILLITRNNVAPKTLLHPVSTASDSWLCKIKSYRYFQCLSFIILVVARWQVIKCVSPFHARHKARVFHECENKNMKIFASVASVWYVEDSKIDFKNESTAHDNRLLLFY